MERLGLLSLIRAHWYGLSRRSDDAVVADWIVRGVFLVLPLVAAWRSFDTGFQWDLDHVGSLLAGASLIAGALLAGFGQLSSWRTALTDRATRVEVRRGVDLLDESVAHILLAAVEAVVIAALCVGYLAVPADRGLERMLMTCALVWMGTHLTLLFLVLAMQLYAGYTLVYPVRRELDGFRGRPLPKKPSSSPGRRR